MDVWDSATQKKVLGRIRQGAVIGYPTETVWGLAALPAHAERLSARKGREESKPLQVSCSDAASALALARPDPQLATLAQFWPGPLTIVARAAPTCPPPLSPGGWVGLRVPAHPVALELLRVCGPLATTSLNPAGQPAAQTYQQAEAYALADLLLQSGPNQNPVVGLASTVLRLPQTPGAALEVLRLGALPLSALQDALPQATFNLTGEKK